MHVECISDVEKLRGIQPAWEDLLAQSPADDIFLTPQWVFSWWTVYGRDKTLLCVACWEQEQLLGLFPLYGFRRSLFRGITFIGHPDLADRMDCILHIDHIDACLNAFSEWLSAKKDWDYLYLPSCGMFTDYPKRLFDSFSRKGLKSLLDPDNVCYYLQTGDFTGYEGYLKTTRGKKTLKTIRRNRKKLNQLSGVEWIKVDHVKNELIDEAAELDTVRSIRGVEKQSFFCDPAKKKFMKAFAREIGQMNRMGMVACRIEGQLSSYELYFNYRKRFLAYQSAFERNHASVSLGVITQLEAIKHAFENHFVEYDFLSGDEDYKKMWSGMFRQASRFRAYSGSFRSRFLYMRDAWINPVLRSVKRGIFGRKTIDVHHGGGETGQ